MITTVPYRFPICISWNSCLNQTDIYVLCHKHSTELRASPLDGSNPMYLQKLNLFHEIGSQMNDVVLPYDVCIINLKRQIATARKLQTT